MLNMRCVFSSCFNFVCLCNDVNLLCNPLNSQYWNSQWSLSPFSACLKHVKWTLGQLKPKLLWFLFREVFISVGTWTMLAASIETTWDYSISTQTKASKYINCMFTLAKALLDRFRCVCISVTHTGLNIGSSEVVAFCLFRIVCLSSNV